MREKTRKKAPHVNLENKGNKNYPFWEIGEVGQRGSLINRAIALISLISPITLICYLPREYPPARLFLLFSLFQEIYRPTVIANLRNKK